MRVPEQWLDQWEMIVEQVDKDHIPVECIKKIIFKLSDKRQKTINFKLLKAQHLDLSEINDVVERYIQANESDIRNMEFVLDVQAVAELLQPETDKILNGL